MRKHILSIFCFLFVASLAYGQSARGIALVIGNGSYVEGPLKNPVNDANDVSAKFKSLGFDVICRLDANWEQLGKSIDEFGSKASEYDVAIFYYSGHGIQYQGDNYLIPVNAKLRSEADIRYNCENLSRVLDKLNESNCKLKILMLDACRNNPFERSWSRSGSSSGLSLIDAPMGTIISYATSPGSTADDGVGQRNSPYTTVFLKLLDKPNYPIVMLYNELCNIVRKNTDNRQNPWSSNSGIDGFFCFNNAPEPKDHEPKSLNDAFAEALDQVDESSLHELIDQFTVRAVLVSGRVTDENGKPLKGVKVTLSGKTDSCFTDVDGKYEIVVIEGTNKALEFSMSGMETLKIPVNDKSRIDAVLKHISSQKLNTLLESADMLHQKGDEYYKRAQYAEAVECYRQAAEKGNLDAQCDLGNCYRLGKGVQKDAKESFNWYKKSAEQGNATAMYHVGLCYDEGNGVSQDLLLAKYWYRKASDRGDFFADMKLRELNHFRSVAASVRGVITDVNGVPLEGVVVYAEGTKRFAISKSNGKYRIWVGMGRNKVLEFSMLGMESRRIPVFNFTKMDVLMQVDKDF